MFNLIVCFSFVCFVLFFFVRNSTRKKPGEEIQKPQKKPDRLRTDGDFSDFSCLDTAGAYLHGTDRSLKHHPKFFQVGVPPPSGFVIGVADIVPEHGSLVTHLASFCHARLLTSINPSR